MRFLNTWTGEFEWHDPKEVRYAILSHVWRTATEGGEQTFDDVRQIQAVVKAARQDTSGYYTIDWSQLPSYPRTSPLGTYSWFLPSSISVIFSNESPLSHKIKGLCNVARDAGFDLVWNDTCCIDKSSSAELSEAINSMYEWYRLSDMCYVYLADVPDGDIPQDLYSRFQRSRWHKRGWTLQELIAPERIEFLTSRWRFLGTKLGLAGTLARITRIDVSILLGWAPVHSASVARRMSWAAERETTRIEDQAYSLMGLFGVHMSPIYGEAVNAFLRLQEEVIRTIPDQSIFSWSWTPYDHERGCPDMRLSSCLLASSPKSFFHSQVKPTALSEFTSRLNLQGPEEVPPLDCTFAPQGVRIRLLCVDLTREVQQCVPRLRQRHDSWCANSPSLPRAADRLALLQCEDEDGDLVGLAFHSSDVAGDGLGSLVGDRCPCKARNGASRLIPLSREELAAILEVAKPEMAEVSLLRYPSDPPPSKSLLRIDSLPTLNLWLVAEPDLATFSLSPHSVASLRTLGFTVSPLHITGNGGSEIILETILAWRDGGHLHYIPLRIALRKLHYQCLVMFRFSSAAPLCSPGLASISATNSCIAMDSEVSGSNSEQFQKATIPGVYRQRTLAQFDLIIRPYLLQPQWTLLLRLSLERDPKDRLSAGYSSHNVLLVVEMSQDYTNVPQTKPVQNSSGDTTTGDTDGSSKHDRTSKLKGDSAKSQFPTNLSGVGSQSPDPTTTRCAALEERMDPLGRENSAMHVQVSAVREEMGTKVDALASQNTAITNQNAALASQNIVLARENAALREQMAAVWQRLDALTVAAAAAASSLPARADAT